MKSYKIMVDFLRKCDIIPYVGSVRNNYEETLIYFAKEILQNNERW